MEDEAKRRRSAKRPNTQASSQKTARFAAGDIARHHRRQRGPGALHHRAYRSLAPSRLARHLGISGPHGYSELVHRRTARTRPTRVGNTDGNHEQQQPQHYRRARHSGVDLRRNFTTPHGLLSRHSVAVFHDDQRGGRSGVQRRPEPKPRSSNHRGVSRPRGSPRFDAVRDYRIPPSTKSSRFAKGASGRLGGRKCNRSLQGKIVNRAANVNLELASISSPFVGLHVEI